MAERKNNLVPVFKVGFVDVDVTVGSASGLTS